jgi:hypothetical protein
MLLISASLMPASAAFLSAVLNLSGLMGQVTIPDGFFAMIV